MSVYVPARSPRHVSAANIFMMLKLAVFGTPESLPKFKRYSEFIYMHQHKGKKGCNTALGPGFILSIIHIWCLRTCKCVCVFICLCLHFADRYCTDRYCTTFTRSLKFNFLPQRYFIYSIIKNYFFMLFLRFSYVYLATKWPSSRIVFDITGVW